MSDYMFMLESHLTPPQNRVLGEVQAAAFEAGLNIFLTGGAMRDMLGGFAIRDLDFTLEGSPLKLARTLAVKRGAKVVSIDENRKSAEIEFPDAVTVELAMSRREKYAKAGARPQVTPATIYEDLRGRDFTINAVALSLNKGSRGLVIDPTNGVGDIHARELRSVSNYGLYDDPSRILRLLRFQVRFAMVVDERTRNQYRNAREAGLAERIPAVVLRRELHQIAQERNAFDLLKLLEAENLLALFSPALAGAKLNAPGFQKLQKTIQAVPFGVEFQADPFGLFMTVLTEKLSSREKSALVKQAALDRTDLEKWQKLEARSKKLERDLQSARLQKQSLLYALLAGAEGEQVLFLLMNSKHRLVHDRIRNYLQKHLLTVQEVTEKEVVAAGGELGTPAFAQIRQKLIASRLDARVKKVVPVEEPPPTVMAAGRK